MDYCRWWLYLRDVQFTVRRPRRRSQLHNSGWGIVLFQANVYITAHLHEWNQSLDRNILKFKVTQFTITAVEATFNSNCQEDRVGIGAMDDIIFPPTTVQQRIIPPPVLIATDRRSSSEERQYSQTFVQFILNFHSNPLSPQPIFATFPLTKRCRFSFTRYVECGKVSDHRQLQIASSFDSWLQDAIQYPSVSLSVMTLYLE